MIGQQKAAILQLNDFIKNYGKAGKRKEQVTYLTNRLTELTEWWRGFEKRNDELILFEDNSQPYFAEGTFDNVKQTYLKHRENVYMALNAANVNATNGATLHESSDDEALNSNKNSTSTAINVDNNSMTDIVHDLPYQIPTEAANSGFVALKNQLKELYEVYEMVDDLTEASTMGYIAAQLDILKSAWGDFRSKYNKERDNENLQISNVNFKAVQAKYALYYGLLNDLKAKKASRADGGRLAKIKLKEFSGKLDEWPGFIFNVR